MKKVLFFAAVLAVASMTFVACGKKENKEAEGQNTECAAQDAQEVGEDAADFVEPAAAPAVDRAEAAVRAIEAANSLEEVMAIEAEYDDLTIDDFTPEQQDRMMQVAAKFGM